MAIFLTFFFGISAVGHALEYVKTGNLTHMMFFALTVFLALWHVVPV